MSGHTYVHTYTRTHIPYIGKFSLLKRCQPRKFNTRNIFNNYHGQQIVTRARACLIFVDGNEN